MGSASGRGKCQDCALAGGVDAGCCRNMQERARLRQHLVGLLTVNMPSAYFPTKPILRSYDNASHSRVDPSQAVSTLLSTATLGIVWGVEVGRTGTCNAAFDYNYTETQADQLANRWILFESTVGHHAHTSCPVGKNGREVNNSPSRELVTVRLRQLNSKHIRLRFRMTCWTVWCRESQDPLRIC
ncbi:hypothetical protein BJ508DRAFT_178415 [Ascobolus immersus RN42]|uniref:Uncharacterized protein n=1 Tax=Ascobolus immersus RN42 TaxID=1160509 RepID=A0A3N4IMZ7_ASCIM|nr:hypothetical protein BJ508DRAFT_178415 [Ascobolus immersus RN42]